MFFSESAAQVVAASLLAEFYDGEEPEDYGGIGACYIEFGAGRVAKLDVNFLLGPKPSVNFTAPSVELMEKKDYFGSQRRARWFDL